MNLLHYLSVSNFLLRTKAISVLQKIFPEVLLQSQLGV